MPFAFLKQQPAVRAAVSLLLVLASIAAVASHGWARSGRPQRTQRLAASIDNATHNGDVVTPAGTPSASATPGLTTLTIQAVNRGVTVDKGRCLELPAGRYGTYDCGNLRFSYGLPSTSTMGRTWTPTLIYNSDQTPSSFLISTDVAASITGAGSSVTLDVSAYLVGDTITTTVTVPNDGQARRVILELPFAYANNVATGKVFYGLTVTDGVHTAGDTGTMYLPNGIRNPFFFGQLGGWYGYLPSGWALAGVEQIIGSGGLLQWIGGDGSTGQFQRVGGTNYWLKTVPTVRPDTIKGIVQSLVYNEVDDYCCDTTWKWRHLLPNAAYVDFDSSGNHRATVNSQGLKTRFTGTAARPDSIILPTPPGSSLVRAYRFEYVTDTLYSAPPNQAYVAGVRPRVRVHAPTINGSDRDVDLLLTPQGPTGYAGPAASLLIAEPTGDTLYYNIGDNNGGGANTYVRDRLGHLEYFSIFANNMLAAVLDSANDSTATRTTFAPAERGPLVLSSSVRTVVDGPRSDIDDTTRFAVNKYGAPTLIHDALGNETTITYGDSRFSALVTSIVHPNGFTEQQAFNSRGLVDSSVAVSPYGGSNAITKYTWHSSRPLPLTRKDPTGGQSSFSYDTAGNRLFQQVGTDTSTRVHFTYDTLNRGTYVQEPGHTTSQRQHIEYDALLGNVSKVTSPIGFYSEFTRDSIGRLTHSTAPFDSAGSHRTGQNFAYDIKSRVVKTTTDTISASYTFPNTALSAITGALVDSVVYDREGRTSRRLEYGGGAMLASYSFAYDGIGRTTSEDGPGGLVTHTYDAAGNAQGTHGVTLQFDALGRVTQRITPGSSSGFTCHPMITSCSGSNFHFPMYGGTNFVVPTDTATFTYDAMGDVLTANNIDGRISRTYFANGKLKTDTLRIRTYTRTSNANTDFATHAYGLKYEYDLSGRRAKQYHPTALGYGCDSSCYQSAAYDTLTGNLTGMTSIRGHTFTFGYDAEGRLSSSAGPGGTQQTFTYDLDGRLVQRLDKRGLGSVDTVHHDFASFDGTGRITRDTTTGLSAFQQVTRNGYDGGGHLAVTEYDQVSPSLVRTERWAFDPLGNPGSYDKNYGLSTAKTRASSYADSTSRLNGFGESTSTSVPVDSSTFHYDSYGRQDQQMTIRTAGSATGHIYTMNWYAADGTIYGFQRQGADSAPDTWSVLEEYRYDALGRRILVRSRTDSTCTTATTAWCRSAIQRYVYDGTNLLYEIRVPGANSLSSTALEVDTATGPYYGRIGYVLGGGTSGPLAIDRDGLVVIPHQNWRHLFDGGTDTTGAACCSTIDWVAKNQAAYLDGTPLRSPSGWGGSVVQSQQDASGLMYFANRYYDPSTGRFTQSDPIGIAGGANAYGFANGDPMTFSDPMGLWPCNSEIMNLGLAYQVDGDDGSVTCVPLWGDSGAQVLGPTVSTAQAPDDPGAPPPPPFPAALPGAESSGHTPSQVCNEDLEQFAGAFAMNYFGVSALRLVFGLGGTAVGFGAGIEGQVIKNATFAPALTALQAANKRNRGTKNPFPKGFWRNAYALGKMTPVVGAGLELGEALNSCGWM